MNQADRFKIEAFMRQFKVTKYLMPREIVTRVSVNKVDPDLLEVTSPLILTDGIFWQKWWNRIHFLDCNFFQLGRVGERWEKLNPNWKRWQLVSNFFDIREKRWIPCPNGSFQPGSPNFRPRLFVEKVGQAIDRLAVDDTAYILEINPVVYHRSVELTIHKVPRGYTLKDWMEKQYSDEVGAMKEGVEAIDALGK